MKIKLVASTLKKFADLGTTSYVDVHVNYKEVIFVSSDSINTVFYRIPHNENIEEESKFRIQKSLLKKLAVDGILKIRTTREAKVVLEFLSEEISLYKVRLQMQIVDSSKYNNLIDLNIKDYEEIDLTQLKPIAKVASLFDQPISTHDNVCFMNLNSAIFMRKVEAPDITVTGKSLQKLYKLGTMYNVQNMIASELEGITLFVKKSLQVTFEDSSYIDELIESSTDSITINMNKVAILAKKLGLKEGESKFNLSDGTYTYMVNDMEFQVTLSLDKYINKTIGIPDWIVKDLLISYPELLGNITLKLINTRVVIETKEFKILFRARTYEE